MGGVTHIEAWGGLGEVDRGRSRDEVGCEALFLYDVDDYLHHFTSFSLILTYLAYTYLRNGA